MPFRLRIEPSGHDLDIEADETILEAALRQGFNVPYSCRSGTCGTCKGRLLDGQVDYGEVDEKVLTPADRENGLALFCQAMPVSDVTVEIKEVGAAKGIVIKTLPARVHRIEDLAPDVRALFLKIPATEKLPFLPGQYIDILLKDGARRGFSLANTPNAEGILELHIKRVPGGRFTTQVFEQMKEKDILRFEGPLGTFFIREESTRPLLMAATGTGFAPIKGMLQWLLERGEQRPVQLYWGVRHPQDFYYGDLLREWTQVFPDFTVHKVVSRPDAQWTGARGYITDHILQDFPDPSEFDAYICGHPDMCFSLADRLRAAGLDEAHIFADAFVFAKSK
ncbi:MAG: CDP-6-deoxy-delta-3,4-glucoseen reductase [Acidithiobacillus sp.]